MVDTSVIRLEKDFYLKECTLFAYNGAEYDIKLHRTTFRFHEDIFSPFISASLDIDDAVDYPHWMPLIGEEKIKIVLTRQDETGKGEEGGFLPDMVLEFRVYKVSGRQTQNDKIQTYTLHLVSEEFIKNMKQKVYRAWKAKPYSDIVQEIYDEKIKINKPIVIEPTKYDQDFISRNISPMELMQQLASRSISSEENGTAYLFFEDREKFNFVSIGKLLTAASTEEYYYAPRNVMEQEHVRPIESDIKNADHYHWNQSFDVLKNLSTGMYGQNLITVDPLRQVFEEIPFDLNAEFDKFKHVDTEKFFTDKLDALNGPDASVKLVFTNKDHDVVEHIVARDPTIKPYKLEEYVLHRTSQLIQIDNFKVGINVSGDPRRKVGDVIEFKLPQVAGRISDEFPQELDNYFQGRYLVASIQHNLSLTGYEMKLELIKDTFFSKIEHVDVVELYKNIY